MQGSRSRRSSHDEGQLVVIRSSDGAAFPLSSRDGLAEISTLDRLRNDLLSPLLEIPPDCLILMNDQGIPLVKEESLQQLLRLSREPRDGPEAADSVVSEQSGEEHRRNRVRAPQDPRLYVFDREHLDADPELVADTLRIDEEMVLNEPPLHLEDPLTSHLSLSLHNLSTLQALTSSIKNQRSSLSLALSNLHRVNSGTSTSFHLYLETAEPLLHRYGELLEGWEHNMDSIKRVRVVNGLLVRGGGPLQPSSGSVVAAAGQQQSSSLSHQREASTSQASATRGGGGGGATVNEDKQRYLGDYVSTDKMVAVRDGCAKILAELRMRAETLQVTLDDVMANAEAVQADLEATSRDLEDLEACEQDAEHGHLRIEELVHAGESMTDSSLLAQCFEELSVCDAEHRDRIRFLIERKNAMTRYLLLQMQKISALQSDIASMPSDLGLLDHDLRTRTENFKHLARLEGLIPAYIATVSEVVRRKEYSRLLSTHAVSLADVVKPWTAIELSRRRHYRTNFSGKLPWEVRGLGNTADELVPEIGFRVDLRGVEGLPELGIDTLYHLRTIFEELVRDLPPRPDADPMAHSSGSHNDRPHPLEKGKALLDELVSNVEHLSHEFDEFKASSTPTRKDTEVDIVGRTDSLEKELRRIEDAHEQLSRQLQSERSLHEEAVAKLENRCSTAEGAERRAQVQAEQSERDRVESETRVGESQRECERWNSLFETEKARRTDLEKEVHEARVETEHVRKSLDETERDLVDALHDVEALQERVAEQDKQVGALRSEADLDRAVLEKELAEIRESFEATKSEIERYAGRNRTLEEIAEGLREQIARWEAVTQAKEDDIASLKRQLDEVQWDKEMGIVDAQKELVQAQKQARAAVVIAGKLRDENDNITRALNSPPPRRLDATSSSTAAELDRATQPPQPMPPADDASSNLPSLDYASGDIDELLRELEQVSHVPLAEAIRNRMDGLTTMTKKWVKEAKAYRERAHRAASGANDKIAFRHFAKGDLALFLPTRNATVPVWAAFNVSFPHHFLSPTGVIAEQMKTREWIVARITSFTETIVDAKDPSTNPYVLPPGTKFFMLEVEPWSSKDSSRSRKHSSDKDKDKSRKSSSNTPSRPTRSNSELLVSSRAPSSTTESAILVDRPTPVSSPSIRRTMSEGLPRAQSVVARPEHAIAEADEMEADADTLSPSPPNLRQSVPRSFGAGPAGFPSGLTRALALSQPSTPSQQKSDPFVASSAPSPNPFQMSSSPVVGSPLRQAASPPTTDYDPSHSTTGASPAFLPSAAKKNQPSSTASSLSASNQSPRYIRSSPSSRKDSRALSITGSRPNPSTFLSSSPASSSANSIHGASQPRSASSGSSILSSSMHRRGLSGLNGISPSLIDGKALPTKEAQLNDSRWNLLQDGLEENDGRSLSSTYTTHVPAGREGNREPLTSSSPAEAGRAGLGGRSLREGSSTTASVFDMLIGKARSNATPVERQQPAASTFLSKKKKEHSDTAEGEIRKLLGQPQF